MGCLAEIGARAKARDFTRVALFTDPFLRNGPYFDTAVTALQASGIDAGVFSEIRIEPDDNTVIAAAEFLRGGRFDGVISVGGGSTMDTAKAGMVYALYPTEFTDYFGSPVGASKPVPGPLLPHIACPDNFRYRFRVHLGCGNQDQCTKYQVCSWFSLLDAI